MELLYSAQILATFAIVAVISIGAAIYFKKEMSITGQILLYLFGLVLAGFALKNLFF